MGVKRTCVSVMHLLIQLAEAVAQGRATFRHSLVLGEDNWGGAYTRYYL